MKKDGRKKMVPVFLTLILLLSVLVFVPQGPADSFIGVFPNGIVWKSTGLTCGEELVYKVTTRDLDPETDYTLQIDNGTAWIDLEGDESTKDGDLFIEFNAPGWANLDPDNNVNPIGTWDLRLWNDETDSLEAGYEAQITISNLYKVEFMYGGDTIDNLIYNTTYAPIYMYINNWTGSRYSRATDKDFYTALYNPDTSLVAESEDIISNGIWDLDLTDDDLNFNNGAGNLEYYLTVEVDDIDPTGNDTYTALPVLLAITATYPDDAEWGDQITVTGYVKDGQGNGIGGYPVALYSPVDGGYIQMEYATTYSTGRYSMTVDTGYDEGYLSDGNAGTWYIGTVYPGGLGRVDESDKFEHPIDLGEEFVRYYWFDVAPDTDVDIEIESPDEIINGFEQTINVSCEWNSEAFDGDDPDAIEDYAWIHFTGLDCYFDGEEYEDDDIVVIDHTMLNGDEDVSYLVFDITFNETGTGTFIVTHPHDNDDLAWPMFNNTDLDHNIMGTLNFQVGSAADMNMIVYDEPEYVAIDYADGDGDCWVNDTDYWYVEIEIYGEDAEDWMNASIQVTGCGLDFTIDEDDEVGDNDYLIDKDWGWYLVKISPKTGGTLTITATNSTDELSVTKDFKIKGLKGSVITSVGDDKEISVESTETITATIQGGDYAEVVVSYYDEDWNYLECALYEAEGDGETQGEGLNGIYEFQVEDEDIEDGVGYLVVVAYAAGLAMYEIIEIAPVHDLTVELISPINWTSKAFTVGLEHEDFEFKVYGPNGDVIDDIDEFYAKLVDEDNDEDHPLQTIQFKEQSGSKWVPDDELRPWFKGELIFTAVNNSGENEHDGNITYSVDYATITYSPESVTAGIELEDIEIELLAVDANGDPLPENTNLYLWLENDTGDLDLDDYTISLDEDGMGDFVITCVGDLKTWINATLDDNEPCDGNLTAGNLSIDWPVFTVEPDTIYINYANTVTVTAVDYLGDPIEHLNLTIWPSLFTSFGVPDPVETKADGIAVFDIAPDASGKANVTIVRDIVWVDGLLDWDLTESVITDTYITITALKTLEISVSKSPINQGETLTVTVTSGTTPVSGADVTFGSETKKTGSDGTVDFTVPDPGVEFAVYKVSVSKTGYVSKSVDVTVIKVWEIKIATPKNVYVGETFTVTISVKGDVLVGAEAVLDDGAQTAITDSQGRASFKAGSKGKTHTITAEFGNYEPGTATVTVKEKGTPGFELLTLIIAIGVAFILLKRRRN